MAQGLGPRLLAATAIASVVGEGSSLDDALDQYKGRHLSDASPRDLALARSIATVALRRLGTIRSALARFLQRGMPKRAGPLEWHLVVAAAQVLFLEVADHAAVDLGVHAVRSAPGSASFASLANAVLRNIVRQRDAILEASDPLADDTPAWLAASWTKSFGLENAHAIATAHQQEPTLDLTVKEDAEGWARRLDGVVLPTGSVRLRARTPVRDLEGYQSGHWWVQDAAAALPVRLLAVRPGERVADICAAPGGKTAALIAAGAQVVSVDRSPARVERLRRNLDRLRYRAEVVLADVVDFDRGPFDAVLLDAPCSSTGTIRRHPDVAWAKQATDVAALAALQSRLLDRAAALLRPGGRLVYCTCSLQKEEGEDQVAALLQRRPDLTRIAVTAEEIGGLSPCITADGNLRTMPYHLPAAESRLAGLDGFFAARLVLRG